MGDDTNISKLLQLKKYEQPPSEYFEDFLFEFRRRQRVASMQRSPWAVWWERVIATMPTFRVPQMAYASILALGIGASAVIVNQKSSPASGAVARNDSAPMFSLTSPKPVTIGEVLPVAARMSGSLPSHYVLQPRPASNDQPLSF